GSNPRPRADRRHRRGGGDELCRGPRRAGHPRRRRGGLCLARSLAGVPGGQPVHRHRRDPRRGGDRGAGVDRGRPRRCRLRDTARQSGDV
ncbi:MAG: hypothetical protein AVDCRST_MAG49-2682, partial [uncultured Thermomicrobiales bacterium]